MSQWSISPFTLYPRLNIKTRLKRAKLTIYIRGKLMTQKEKKQRSVQRAIKLYPQTLHPLKIGPIGKRKEEIKRDF